MIRGKLGEKLVRMLHVKFQEDWTELTELCDEKSTKVEHTK